jgi:hypothetical protein
MRKGEIMLVALAVVLLIIALAGGIAVNPSLFLIALLALLVFLGRSVRTRALRFAGGGFRCAPTRASTRPGRGRSRARRRDVTELRGSASASAWTPVTTHSVDDEQML